MSEIHKAQMRQAKLSFNRALPLGAIGILVAIWAAISWPQGRSKDAGFGIGAIMEVLMFVLLRFHSEMNRRPDEAQKEIRPQRREDRLFLKSLRIADPSQKRCRCRAPSDGNSRSSTAPRPTMRKGNSSGARSDNDGAINS